MSRTEETQTLHNLKDLQKELGRSRKLTELQDAADLLFVDASTDYMSNPPPGTQNAEQDFMNCMDAIYKVYLAWYQEEPRHKNFLRDADQINFFTPRFSRWAKKAEKAVSNPEAADSRHKGEPVFKHIGETAAGLTEILKKGNARWNDAISKELEAMDSLLSKENDLYRAYQIRLALTTPIGRKAFLKQLARTNAPQPQ
ncbi:MAG: hypothetical protein PHE27_00720 [Alphaproteobacteria bacterium]|nr:hypothetical protein [Alphaproteobacteria bacterium]